MNERVRRILIFVTIVGAGTLLILNDLPLLVILPLIIMIGLVLLILLGAIPLSELKTLVVSRFGRGAPKQQAPAAAPQKPAAKPAAAAPAAPVKKRFSVSLGSLFRKKEPEKAPAAAPAQKAGPDTAAKPGIAARFKSLFAKKPQAPAKGGPAAVQKPAAAPVAGKKKGISLHISSLVSSVKAMGTILTTKKKADPDKMKKIDSMLDHAVSEKVDTAPSTAVRPVKDSAAPAAGMAAGGAAAPGPAPAGSGEEDPFLSLSDDDLEAGLLDGLDDDDMSGLSPGPEAGSPEEALSMPDMGDSLETGAGGLPLPSPDAPALDAETAAAADDILKANQAEAGDLPSLDGLEPGDGNLGELDNLSLDSMDLDEDDEDEIGDRETGAPSPAPAAAPAAAPAPAAPAPAAAPSKTKSDQSEMASFAAASGGDDDMLSSLAADIKTVKKEQDISLLRELKDFRATGTAIETELTDLYSALNAATEKQKKIKPVTGKPVTGKPVAGKKPQAK